MTKAELEKEAKEYAEKQFSSFVKGIREIAKISFKKGAEPREKRIAELEAQIKKMKCCSNCRFGYCERSSERIDENGNRTFHCWNEEKEKYCDVGKNGKYQCWELRR